MISAYLIEQHGFSKIMSTPYSFSLLGVLNCGLSRVMAITSLKGSRRYVYLEACVEVLTTGHIASILATAAQICFLVTLIGIYEKHV